MFWASPLNIKAPSGVDSEALFSTTPYAWLQTKDFSASPEGGTLLESEAYDTTGTKVLGAALSGVFPSYFSGKPKPSREGSSEELPDLTPKAQSARIIVVGDSDIGSVFIQSQRNLDFFVQSMDWLRQDEDIIYIRNRSSNTRRLDRISDPGRKLAVMNGARVINIFVLPVLIIVVFVLKQRHRRIKG